MSQYQTQSPKHCSQKALNKKKLAKKLYLLILAVVAIVFLIIMIAFTVHPKNPEFSALEVTVYNLNVSASNLVTCFAKATLLAKNPNQKVGIRFEELSVYAAYREENISSVGFLGSFFLAPESTMVLSTMLVGTGHPVLPLTSYELRSDQSAGRVVVQLKVGGQLKWKLLRWTYKEHQFGVSCDVETAFGAGLVNSRPQLGAKCSSK